MRFGISTFVTDEGVTPAALGRAVEQRGFDALLLAEHTHIPVSRETPYPGGGDLPRIYYRTLDPFVALSTIAAVTERLTVGTGIALMVERDPIVTANEVASLDLVSGGRFLFGVGAGWNREEMRNHGTDPTRRGAILNERLQAMRRLWTEEQAEFHGTHVEFDPVFSWPKPAQQPHPPIYIGGESAAAESRVVELGNGWLPRAGTPNLEDQIARVRDRAGWRVPVTLFSAPSDIDVDAHARAGVDRIAFRLPTLPEDETLGHLDKLAQVIAVHS